MFVFVSSLGLLQWFFRVSHLAFPILHLESETLVKLHWREGRRLNWYVQRHLVIISARARFLEHLTAPMTSYDQPVKVMSKRSFSSTRHTSALATKLLQLHTDPSVYKTTAATHECTE